MGIPKRLNRAEQTAQNGRRLLEAARATFVENGYYATTLDTVALAAGFTKGAVYSRFSSKADLFLHLLEERIDERCREIQALSLSADGGDSTALFRQGMRRLRTDTAWTLLVIEFRVAAARDPALNARYSALHERMVAAVADAAERDAAAKQMALAVPAKDAARLGLSLASGMFLERAVSGAAFPEALAERGDAVLFAALTVAQRRARRAR
ncbi:MAG TPA: helix-turn-helix domain-containing protein [Polyangiaceae bacterium]|nr:helix-turn-helix domain-containing protein [Polyangiaceae bacterium]